MGHHFRLLLFVLFLQFFIIKSHGTPSSVNSAFLVAWQHRGLFLPRSGSKGSGPQGAFPPAMQGARLLPPEAPPPARSASKGRGMEDRALSSPPPALETHHFHRGDMATLSSQGHSTRWGGQETCGGWRPRCRWQGSDSGFY